MSDLDEHFGGHSAGSCQLFATGILRFVAFCRRNCPKSTCFVGAVPSWCKSCTDMMLKVVKKTKKNILTQFLDPFQNSKCFFSKPYSESPFHGDVKNWHKWWRNLRVKIGVKTWHLDEKMSILTHYFDPFQYSIFLNIFWKPFSWWF